MSSHGAIPRRGAAWLTSPHEPELRLSLRRRAAEHVAPHGLWVPIEEPANRLEAMRPARLGVEKPGPRLGVEVSIAPGRLAAWRAA